MSSGRFLGQVRRYKRLLLLLVCAILAGLLLHSSVYDESRPRSINSKSVQGPFSKTNNNIDVHRVGGGIGDVIDAKHVKIKTPADTMSDNKLSLERNKRTTLKKRLFDNVENRHILTSNMRSLYHIPNFNSPDQKKDPDLVHNTGVQRGFVLVDSSQFLRSDLAPNTVHYVWCGRRVFQFKHYLSVLSVIKYIQPDVIIMHYYAKPEVDIKRYNQWIWELTHEFPFLTFKRIRSGQQDVCLNQGTRDRYVYDLLRASGGIYVEEHTILSEFPFKFRQYDLFSSVMSQGGFLVVKPGVLRGQRIEMTFHDERLSAGHSPCATYTEFNANSMQYSCVANDGNYFPKDIWTLHNAFGRLARKIMYDSEVLPKPAPTYDSLVPNIAHMVWTGGGQMDFLFYLSVLSVLHVLKAEVLYIHGDQPPTGAFWESVKDNPRIVHVHRDKPETIYQNAVKSPQHISDIWRVDFMVKYGGIYCDVDTIWVQPLNPVLRGYDAVASYDWVYWDPPYPDIINFGVTLGKRGATFWHLFQRSMQYFRQESWGFNGLRQPYKVYEKYPALLKVDERLQVICFNFRCHPTWNKNYHNESIDHLNTPFDWRKDTFSVHWTAPVPKELRSIEALSSSKTMFADIGRYVLQQAGLWK